MLLLFHWISGILSKFLPWLSCKILQSRNFYSRKHDLGSGQWIVSHYPYQQTTSNYCFYTQISHKNHPFHPQNSLFTSKYPWMRQLSPFCSWRCWFSRSRHSKMGICNIDLENVWTNTSSLHSAQQWCCCGVIFLQNNTRENGRRVDLLSVFRSFPK